MLVLVDVDEDVLVDVDEDEDVDSIKKRLTEWTKIGADYESKDIVLECKSHQEKKEDGRIVSWILNGLKKAEIQTAVSIYKSLENSDEDSHKNIGIVSALFNTNQGNETSRPIFLVIEFLINKQAKNNKNSKQGMKKNDNQDSFVFFSRLFQCIRI